MGFDSVFASPGGGFGARREAGPDETVRGK